MVIIKKKKIFFFFELSLFADLDLKKFVFMISLKL